MNEEQETFKNYFEDIKKIWSKLNNPNRIIPFCTPLIMRPDFLIIGTNHSNNFDKNQSKNEEIADSFATEIAKENTFLTHNHPFAEGLKDVVNLVQNDFKDFKISSKWVGTNRCAIQTDSGGLGDIPKNINYAECEKKMDTLLKNFIKFCRPKNIILTGKHACGLFYSDKNLKEMKPKKILKESCNVIPIWHLSELWRWDRYDQESFKTKTINRIVSSIQNGYCEI